VHGRRGRARVRFAGVLGVMALMLVAVSGVFAVHDKGFQLEGNQDSNDKTTGAVSPLPTTIAGTAFDGNIENVANRFLFQSKTARTVSVHSSAIIETMIRMYNNNRIADELLGK
jgi:amino acid permease